MLSKLSVAFVAALAITAHAAHGKHHHAKRHYGYDYGTSNSSVTSVTPLPSASAPSGTIPTISTPIGTGSSASALSTPVNLSTGPSTNQEPSKSVPLGTGPSAPPFPISSKPGSPSKTVPLGTGVTGVPGKETVTVVTSDSTLTYTIGTGSDTTVITTHVKHTSTSTLTQTIYETEAPKGAGEKGTTDSPTTTRFSTITSTHVITVIPVTSSEIPVSNETHTPVANGNHIPVANNNHVVASGSECQAQVTVTVTGSPVTVTVTATPSFAESSGPGGAGELPTSSTLPSYSSAPYNNGTEVATSKTIASSGFLTRTSSFTLKPTGTGAAPIGTGAYYS